MRDFLANVSLNANGSPVKDQRIYGNFGVSVLPSSTSSVEVQSGGSGDCGYKAFVQSTNTILVSYTTSSNVDAYSTTMIEGLYSNRYLVGWKFLLISIAISLWN